MDLKRLSEKFLPSEIEFRVGATNEKRAGKEVITPADRGIALAYITNRAIQDRLDEVCGPDNWKNEFMPWKGDHQLCGISIRVDGEWITKWDGAENTAYEPLKGGLSASMKRAAVQWGIGRYLYDVPDKWVSVVPAGKSYKFADKSELKLPDEFLPQGVANEGYMADVADKEVAKLSKTMSLDNNSKLTPEMTSKLSELILTYNIDQNKLKAWAKVKSLDDLNIGHYRAILELYSEKLSDDDKVKYNKPLNVSNMDSKGLKNLNKIVGAKNGTN